MVLKTIFKGGPITCHGSKGLLEVINYGTYGISFPLNIPISRFWVWYYGIEKVWTVVDR